MNLPQAKNGRKQMRAATGVTKSRRDWIAIALIVALALWCGVFLLCSSLGVALDGKLYDTGLALRAPRTSERIAIVGMTENFVRNRHVAFVPRARLAKLIDVIASGKPAVIVLDVWLDSFIDGPQIGSDDWKLRAAMARAKSRGIAVLLSQSQINDDNRSGLNAAGAVPPFFRNAVTGIGGIDFLMDGDGVFRTLPRRSRSDADAGAAATAGAVKDEKNLSRRILHFATHSVLNAGAPLQSYIQLAQPKVAKTSSSDSNLTLGEVAGLDLASVDLVTLSACRTALGARDPEGREITSLAQAFSTAGAKSIIASLWSVSDASTKTLMVDFYTRLAAGEDKAGTLQNAMRTMRRDLQARASVLLGAVRFDGRLALESV